MLSLSLLLTFFVSQVHFTFGASQHTVQVGQFGGFTFSPSTLAAQVGDLIHFESPPVHVIMQSRSLTDPCTPGGFISSLSYPGLSLVVNDTKPIFIHCATYCAKGMVMIINPASPNDVEVMTRAAQGGVVVTASGRPSTPQSSPPSSPIHPAPSSPTHPVPGSSISGPGPSSGTTHDGLPTPSSAESLPDHQNHSTTNTDEAPASTPSGADSLANGAHSSENHHLSSSPLSRTSGSRTSATEAPSHGNSQRKSAAALTAGLLIAGLFLLALGIWCIWRRRARRRHPPDDIKPFGSLHPTGPSASLPPAKPISGTANLLKYNALSTATRFDGQLIQSTPGAEDRKYQNEFETREPGLSPRPQETSSSAETDTAYLLLEAELARVRSENELLRQVSEPPPYSDGSRSTRGEANS